MSSIKTVVATTVSKWKKGISILREQGLFELYIRTSRLFSRYKPFHDMVRLTDTTSPTIVDGGANRGQTISEFSKRFESPKIISFEPIPDLAEMLESRYRENPNIEIHNLALGASEDMINFNITDNSGQSSPLKPNQIEGTERNVHNEIEVQQSRLDSIIEEDIDILKLDLEGYELEALKGCGDLLSSVDIVFTEVQFVPPTSGAATFCEVDEFLKSEKFVLYDLYSLSSGPNKRLIQGDALYLDKNKFTNIKGEK